VGKRWRNYIIFTFCVVMLFLIYYLYSRWSKQKREREEDMLVAAAFDANPDYTVEHKSTSHKTTFRSGKRVAGPTSASRKQNTGDDDDQGDFAVIRRNATDVQLPPRAPSSLTAPTIFKSC